MVQKIPLGLGTEWQSRSEQVDFERTTGGYYAVRLTLTLENAKKLSKAIAQSVNNARKHEKSRVEVFAHWGKRGPTGYKIRSRVKVKD